MTPGNRSSAQRNYPTLIEFRLVPAGAGFADRRAGSGRRQARRFQIGEIARSRATTFSNTSMV